MFAPLFSLLVSVVLCGYVVYVWCSVSSPSSVSEFLVFFPLVGIFVIVFFIKVLLVLAAIESSVLFVSNVTETKVKTASSTYRLSQSFVLVLVTFQKNNCVNGKTHSVI